MRLFPCLMNLAENKFSIPSIGPCSFCNETTYCSDYCEGMGRCARAERVFFLVQTQLCSLKAADNTKDVLLFTGGLNHCVFCFRNHLFFLELLNYSILVQTP